MLDRIRKEGDRLPMITIVEPKDYIDKLWAKQLIRENAVYRLMRYVIRVDHDGKVLLHNVVTGQLVVLEQEEAEELDKLPRVYTPVLEQLVIEHFLVLEDYDEHQLVIDLRNILRALDKTQNRKTGITHFTILPTTACNARCYYCFEQGCKSSTMTEKTASEVVDFIATRCGEDKLVRISWFGGEPTIASNRINQICEGLQAKGIAYKGEMTTNGYLFDERMIEQAACLWHLTRVMISVDGTEKNYNAIKSFVNVLDNPYQRVMRNIGLLIDRGIQVKLRMNFDLDNYLDFTDLMNEIKNRFQPSPLLQVTVHPINGEYRNHEGIISHAEDSWFEEKIVELNEIVRKFSSNSISNSLFSLRYHGCQATNEDSVVITPEGYLVRCSEQFGEDQFVGNIWEGITNHGLVKEWQQFTEYGKCIECVFYPYCVKISCCSAKDRCYVRREYVSRCQIAMESIHKAYQ